MKKNQIKEKKINSLKKEQLISKINNLSNLGKRAHNW